MNEQQTKLHIVSVVNDFDIFNRLVKSNENMNIYDITAFDNNAENIGISERYNSFIVDNIKPESDFWVVFSHQDFAFLENPIEKLSMVDKNCIYGPIGAKLKNGFYIRSSKIYFRKRFFMGEFLQGAQKQKYGIRVKNMTDVETLDCCCVIVHSSLINKYNLRFDENLKFHMYSEDFCINAKKNLGLKVKVLQFDCQHIGGGCINDEYHNSVEYVKNKHEISDVISTCVEYN